MAVLGACLPAAPLQAFQVTLDSGAGAVTIVDDGPADLNATPGEIDVAQTIGGVFAVDGRFTQVIGSINRAIEIGTRTAGSDGTFTNLDTAAARSFTITIDSDPFTAPGLPLGWSIIADGAADDTAIPIPGDVEVATNLLALTVDPGAVSLAAASMPVSPAVPPAGQPATFGTTLRGVDQDTDATGMRVVWTLGLGPSDRVRLQDPLGLTDPSLFVTVFNAEDKCAFLMNKRAFVVAKVAGADDKACLKPLAATGGDGTACVDDQTTTKTADAESKLLQTFADLCTSPPAFATNVGTCCEGGAADGDACDEAGDCPDGACTGGACVGGAVEDAATAVTHDLFGPTVTVGTDDVGRCQFKIVHQLGLVHAEHWKSLFKCKKENLPTLEDEAGFAATCLGPPQPDFARIAKREATFADKLARLCIAKGATPLSAVLPGACAGETDGDYAACLARRAACRFCEGMITAEDLAVPFDCDAFDDGSVNASCP
jgi:hypothetical protein